MIQYKIVSIFILFSFLSKSYSQTFRGTIKDSQTKEPLAFASVQLLQSKNGLYTNEEGYFEISSLTNKDTLIISYLSYQSQKISLSQLTTTTENTIFLVNSSISLSEVVVKGKKSKSKGIMFGHYDFPTTFNWGSGPASIFMNYYKNINQTSPIIKKLYFDFGKSIKTTHKSLIRVRIMVREGDKGQPTRDIVQENMIVTVKPFTSKLVYDIEKLNITFPKDGIFIGIEVIGVYRKNELQLFKYGNTAMWVTSTQDPIRDKIGEAWNYSPFDRKWFTCNSQRGYRTMFKFGMELEDLEE
jgi:CarboxypepD_reg-like domain